MKSRILVALLAAISAYLLGGCAGGNSGPAASAGTGRAIITVTWPERSRLIPAASNSIHVAFKQSSTVIASQLVPRPASGGQSVVAFSNLKVGALTLAADAHPNADGTGIAQASGTVGVTIQAGQTANVALTMASTIDHLEVSPPAPSVMVGNTLGLSVAAKDSNGAIVLTSPDKTQWSTADHNLATISSSGLLTGVARGSTSVHCVESESGKSVDVPVSVVQNSSIAFAAPIIYSVPVANDCVGAADMDGDGNPDVVIGGGSEFGVLYGHGDGTLDPYVRIRAWTASVNVQDVADLNGDGRPEIIFTDNTGNLGIAYNQGGRSFAYPYLLNLGGISHVHVADLDRDGKPDIVVTLWGDGGSGSIKILLNNGNGTFRVANTYSHIGIVEGVGAGDTNGDGIPDLAVSYETSTVGQSGVSIYYGDGSGGFRGGPSYNVGTMNMNWPALVDLNGDGKRDLIFCHYWGHLVTVLPGNGDGTFGQVREYASPDYPLMQRVADMTGDGQPDIVVANAGTTHITLYRNIGGGNFDPGVQFPSGGDNCRTIALADFNRDGKLDVVVENENSKTIAVLLNTSQ